MLNDEKADQSFFFLKNVSDQTLSLVVFYPKPMQDVQLLTFLYNYCAKAQIKPTIVCFSHLFRYAVSCLEGMSKFYGQKL